MLTQRIGQDELAPLAGTTINYADTLERTAFRKIEGIQLAFNRPRSAEHDDGHCDIGEKAIVHALGLGNEVAGHQLVLSQSLSEHLKTPVITIGAPSPENNYQLGPIALAKLGFGNADPIVKRQARAVRTLLSENFASPSKRHELVVATSTVPGASMAPRLATHLQGKEAATETEFNVRRVVAGDPFTILRREFWVVNKILKTPFAQFAAPMQSLNEAEYHRSLRDELPTHLSEKLEDAELTEAVHRRNIRGLRTKLAGAACLGYLGRLTFWDDAEEFLRSNEHADVIVGTTDSPIAPWDRLRLLTDTVDETLTPRLGLVAFKDLPAERKRGSWDNPAQLAHLCNLAVRGKRPLSDA